MQALKDRYGFLFWLRWIVWFAGSFVLAAIAWTQGLMYFFGPIQGAELKLTWALAVFGSWFLLVIPFMRKKEQIWKRLNDDQEKAVDAWLGGMSLFIGSLILSCLFWTVRYKQQVMESPALDEMWAKSVFGTWLVLLLPFLVMMYRQADRLFKTAEERQLYTPRFKIQSVDEAKRQLSESLKKKIKAIQPALPGGHIVTAILSNGKKIPHVFIYQGREVLGVYDRELDFSLADIIDFEPIPLDNLPAYEETKWLRLDGKGQVNP